MNGTGSADDVSSADLPPAWISVRGFWERLTSREIVRVQRDFRQGYRGEVLWGDALLPEVRSFELSRDEMLAYAYDEDLGFSLGVTPRPEVALAWVIGAPPMEAETIPNRDQLTLARSLLIGSDAPWPFEARSAAERVFWLVAGRRLPAAEASRPLVEAAPPTHRNTAPIGAALARAVEEGRIGWYEAMGWLAHATAPDPPGFAFSRHVLLAALPEAEIPLGAVLGRLRALQPTPADYQRYEASGQVAALHAERELLLKACALLSTDDRVAAALRGVVDNEACEDAFTVKIAIWALGRHNEKSAVDYLVSLLSRPPYRIYLDEIEEALAFLCSGDRLEPAAEAAGADEAAEEDEADDAIETERWSAIRAALPADPAAWWERDAASVFWEKRLRAALTLGAEGVVAGGPGSDDGGSARRTRLAARLREDEVPNVRVAAGGMA